MDLRTVDYCNSLDASHNIIAYCKLQIEQLIANITGEVRKRGLLHEHMVIRGLAGSLWGMNKKKLVL